MTELYYLPSISVDQKLLTCWIAC